MNVNSFHRPPAGRTGMERVRDFDLRLILSITLITFVFCFAATDVSAQGDPKANVNLIGMTPDPADIPDSKYRQQNEPACAIRPGDSACIICAYNDYRAVDELGDAWEGVSQSCDAGNTWRSRLAPGHALHPSPIDMEFAADPRLAALPGMTIFNFIAGYRDSNVGVLAIQHWLEVNKEDADHYEPGLRTFIADTGSEGRFLDKPDMLAVLDPPNRQGTIEITTEMENPNLCETVDGGECTPGYITRKYPTGMLYLAYAAFTGSNSIKVMLKTSSDWGQTWRNQSYKLSEDQNEVSGISLTALNDNKVLAVWRRRGDNNNSDAIMYSVISNGGKKATKGEVLAEICAFDQPTLTGTELQDALGASAYFVTFRTNDFPWTANDGDNFYVFFSERQRDPVTNECIYNSPARVVMKHSSDGLNWQGLGPDNTPIPLDADPVDEAGDEKPGSFQFMPTAFGADGKVQVAWYDTRREFCAGVLPWVADYDGNTWGTSCGQQGFFQRTVDVYTTTVTAGEPIPPPVRASQFSIVVDGDNRYESEASFANKKLFSQGQAPFLGDYIAMAGREFRPTGTGRWMSNATANPESNEDFFVAWTDNRDVRGSIQSVGQPLPYNPPATTTNAANGIAIDSLLDEAVEPEMLAGLGEVSRTGPPRDTTKTAEGLAGADPGALECTPGAANYERSRDSNIYGSLIKDEVRMYATTPVKPLGGLQRAFVVALSNASLVEKEYDLEILKSNQCFSPECTASFRQTEALAFENVIVPAKSTLARTVFVTGNQPPIKVEAREGATLIASIQLANAPEMSDPENCDGSAGCSVDFNELHNLVLQTANAAGLLNAGLLNAGLLNSPLTAMAIDAGACEDPATVGCVIEYGSTLEPNAENAGLLNEALEAAGLLNAGLLNAGLLNAGLLNAGLLNTTLTDDPDDPYYDLNQIPNPVESDGLTPCTSVGCVILYAAGTSNDTYLGYVIDGLDNAGLLNAGLLNAGLLNAGLLNAGLLNAGLLNAGLLNAGLLNATLLNAGLLNPTVEAAGLLNAGLLNAELLNAGLLNPTLMALAVEGGCCDHEAEPTAGSMIIFAVENPDIINASLLNATLLNAGLLNAGLLNAGLLNAELLNAGLLNAELSNAELLNAGLLNADLLNADLLNAGLLNSTMVSDLGTTEVTYDDYTYPITNNGNVTTAIDVDVTIYAPDEDGDEHPDYVGAKLMTWSANATPTIIDCTEYVEVDSRIQSITGPDNNLQVATIFEPFNGETTVIANPGETVFVTLRVIGTPDQLKNVRVSGFTASSQAANCYPDVENPGDFICADELNEGIEQILFQDLIPPTITLNGDASVSIESGGTYTELGATVIDNIDNPKPVTDIAYFYVDEELTRGDEIDGVDTSVVGTYEVTYDAVDSAGNAAEQVSRWVNVVDTTIPVISLTGANPQTIEVGSAYSELGATASDNYDGDISGSIVINATAVNTSVVGSYTVTYNVTDANGNAATEVSRTVDVVDTTIPVISLTGANPQTIEVGSAYSELGATASDNYDGDISGSIVINASAVNTSVVGSYTVTYNVTDANGNAATQVSRTVSVVDTTPPVMPSLPNLTVEATSTDGTPVSWATTALDANQGPIPLICSPASGSLFPLGGPATVNCSATDSYGNTSNASFTVTVTDTSDPAIDPVNPPDGFDPNTPYPFELAYDANTITISWPIGVTDADPNLVISCTIGGQTIYPAETSVTGDQFTATFNYAFGVGDTEVVCTATDSAGGQSDPVTFTVQVDDVTAPVLTVPTEPLEVPFDSNAPLPYEVDYSGNVSAVDVVDGSPTVECSSDGVNNDANLTGSFGYGDTTVTCTATDASGNSSTATFVVRIRYQWDIEVILAKRVAKAGSTIPVDWVYKDWAGNPVDSSSLAGTVSLGWRKLGTNEACTGLTPDDGEDSGSSNFRYSATDMLWQYSWQTPPEKGEYRVTVRPPGGNAPAASACVSLK